MTRRLDIAVAGAGVAGLAAATLLARAGHRVVVYERFETAQPIGSGLMIQPVGLAALDRMGLRADLESRGARLDGIHGVTDRGATVFDLRYSELDTNLYALGVHRAALHEVLWTAFAASGARLETGRTISRIQEAGSRACFVDETGRTLPEADLVLDATGARSTLRGAVSKRRPRDFSYGAVWAAVPNPGIVTARLAQRYVGAHTMLGVMPVGAIHPGGQQLAALFWSLKPGTHSAWSAGFDKWCGEAGALWPELGPCLAALDGPDAFTPASYSHLTVPRPHRGPVALIGDSAHCTSPQLGQGANHGLLDAVILADAIEAARDVETALRTYARERRRHVRFYQFASAVMTPLFQSDSRIAPWVRDLTFHRLKLIPWLKREMVRTLAGLKTGLLTHATAERIAGATSSSRPAA